MPLNHDIFEKKVIKVDIFIPNNDDISQQDRARIKRMFIRFIIDVAFLLFSLFLTFSTFDLFCLVCSLFLLVSSVTAGKMYYSAAAGRGLKTSYLFSAASFSIVNEIDMTEMPYSSIKSVIQRDDGLVIELVGDVVHFLPNDALEESGIRDVLCSFLRKRLAGKYKVYVKTREQSDAEEALSTAEKQERIDSLGKLITTVSYTVTGADMRAYHRIVLRRLGKLRHVLISVIGAFATVLPIVNAITQQPVWYSLFCILLIILALLFLIPKVGLLTPAKLCFFVGKQEKIDCFVHENGIAVKSGNRRVFEKWENMDEVVFDEIDGIYADMGVECTVFLPSDLLIGPVEALIKENYNRAISRSK